MATAAVNTFFIDNKYIVTAPTFRTEAQFDAAVGRAFMDDLTVEPDGNLPGAFTVTNGRTGARYFTTRRMCSCLAGERGQPCKHQAALIMELDVFQSQAQES